MIAAPEKLAAGMDRRQDRMHLTHLNRRDLKGWWAEDVRKSFKAAPVSTRWRYIGKEEERHGAGSGGAGVQADGAFSLLNSITFNEYGWLKEKWGARSGFQNTKKAGKSDGCDQLA